MGNITGVLDTANAIIVLLTGLIGLIGSGIGAYFAIKNWISVIKTKTSNENWTMLMELADAAMKEAEQTTLSGGDKKTMAMNAIAAGAEAAGLDISQFIGRLDSYIDQTIKFVNDMKKSKDN